MLGIVLISALIVGVVGVALWIAQLVKDMNERFDQIEHKLDVVIDQLDVEAGRGQSAMARSGENRQ